MRLIRTTVVMFLLLPLLSMAFQQPQKPAVLSWEPKLVQTVTYRITLQRGLRGGRAEKTEEFNISLKLTEPGMIDVESAGEMKGTVTGMQQEFDVKDDARIPPFLSIVLSSLLPVNGIRVNEKERSWETIFPSGRRIASEKGKISTQSRFRMTVGAMSEEDRVSFQIFGETRLIENAELRSLSRAEKVDMKELYKWNLFLVGSASYDLAKRVIEHADLYYVLMPSVKLMPANIMESIHRHHAEISLNEISRREQ